MKSRTLIISIILLITAIIITGMCRVGEVVILARNLDRFPISVGGYQGHDIPLEDRVQQAIDPDVAVFRNYTAPGVSPVNLYIGYYGTKKGGRSSHTPQGCYPGAGWALMTQSVRSINVYYTGITRSIEVNSLVVNKGNESQVVYYWYHSSGDKVLRTGIQQNIHRFLKRIKTRKDDGAFIRISAPIVKGEMQAEKQLDQFVTLIFPLIVENWPEEKFYYNKPWRFAEVPID